MMVLSVVSKTQSRGSIEIRQSHDGDPRDCVAHNTKITIIKSYYDTCMAKSMYIYVNIIVFQA